MSDKPHSPLKGDLVTESPDLTLNDFCLECGLTEGQVLAYVTEGIIEPHGIDTVQWRFSRASVMISSKARRLERDLGLNPAGVALALQLMNEVESLKHRLAHVETTSQEPEG